MDSLCWQGWEHLIAQDWIGAKISDPYGVFHSEESDDCIGFTHWSFPYQWDARISFSASALSYATFTTMLATYPSVLTPSMLLL